MLHWLPVCQRIDFKIMLLTYKSLHGLGPKYLTDMLPLHKPSRPLRSSETNLLIIPRVNTKHGEAGFSYSATNSWNKLPDDLRLAPTLTTFKKTEDFYVCFSFLINLKSTMLFQLCLYFLSFFYFITNFAFIFYFYQRDT